MNVKVVKQKIKVFSKAVISHADLAREGLLPQLLRCFVRDARATSVEVMYPLGRPASNGKLTWCPGVIKTWASQPNSGELWSSLWVGGAVIGLNFSSASPFTHPMSFPAFPWADPGHSLINTLHAKLHLRFCLTGINLQLST